MWNFKLIAGAFTTMLLAVPTQGFSENLMDIYDMAAQNDPVIRGAIANNQSARESLQQTLAGYKPSVSLNASYRDSDNLFAGNNSASTTEGTSQSYGVNFSQPLFNKNISTQHHIRKQFVEQADVDFEAAKQQLLFRVAERYFDVLSALDTLEFSRAQQKAIERQLDQTKQRFDVGLVAITDVHESQAAYDNAVARNIEAQNDVSKALEALRTLTNQYIENLTPLKSNTPLTPPDPEDIEFWTNLAMEQNLSLMSAKKNVEQFMSQIGASRADYYPKINLSASYSDSDIQDSDSTTVSINLNWDLYSGGSTRSSVKQAQYNLTSAKESLEETRRNTQRQIRNAYANVIAGISRVKALKQSVVSSQSALKASEAGFEVGTRTTVDVLVARQNMFAAQRDYAIARYGYIIDSLNLKVIAGVASIEDLQTISSLLQ